MHKDGGGQKSYILDCVIWSCRQRREMGHQITHPSLTFSRFSLLLSPPFLIFPHSFFFLSYRFVASLFHVILSVGNLAIAEVLVD